MTSNEMKAVAALIAKADYDEVSSIARLLKSRSEDIAQMNKGTLRINDAVEFVNRGLTVSGLVTKINRKTVIVREEHRNGTATKWKVPAIMVKKTLDFA